MSKKLKCVIVDDNEDIIKAVADLCHRSRIIDVVASFSSPKKFLESETALYYDLCILDVCMPEMDGIKVAKTLGKKPVIFMTFYDNMLKSALEVNHIDVLTKPFTREMFDNAIMKAQMFIETSAEPSDVEYAAFNVAESSEKLVVKLADILYVKADVDSRNKEIRIKGGERHTIMGYTFESILKMAPALIQINKAELISVEAVKTFKHDEVTLKKVAGIGKIMHLTLSDVYRKKFTERMLTKKHS